ncbi:amine oxidase [copper-containing] 2-like [Caretta caretta]|uniref:amine oxidase [copper-containing] 2-like n=1 Tax=Caretta caretta TaxID=8467 RepID=UPI003F4C1E56
MFPVLNPSSCSLNRLRAAGNSTLEVTPEGSHSLLCLCGCSNMNLKTVLILLVLALATIFALVCVLLTRGVKPASCEPQTLSTLQGNHSDQSLVFADLTPEEMVQVVRYLQSSLGVPLVDAYNANPSDNCIYYIDVQLPTKAEVLGFLDRGGKRPSRQALAVVYFGNQPDPNVTEYVVGPLPTPTTHQDITVQKYGGKLPYHRRPVLGKEYEQIEIFLRKEAFSTAPTFLSQVLDYDGTNFASLTSAPRGFQSGDRNTWFILFHNVSGFFLHPVGLEVLVDHSSLDVSQWRVSKVFFNGQYYGDLVQLEREFKQGHVKVDPVKRAPPDGGFSSMQPRAAPRAPFPLQYEPHGPRYSVQNNQVVSRAWSFAFGVNVNTGMRLFDIRFKGERIVYEISVQDAISVYGSNCPGGMSTRYMDGSFGIGRFTYPLVRGVDCPYSATYVDTCYLIETQTPEKHKNSICIFEENTGSPLRRHYSNLQSLYYGGLTNSALVLRSIATLGNYDYVWDFLFYENGAIEAKVHATGYMTSSFLYGDGLDYGNKVGDHTLGTIHTHSIHYKVDLDVGGTYNTLVAHDMAFESVQAPWSPEHQIQRPRLTKTVLDTEDKAAFRLHSNMPRYIYFAANSENKWGHQRGYRIQIVSFTGEHLPETSLMERAISWGRYKLAVTKRKEEEPTSSSIYNQNDPWTPTVAFADFINNESIVTEDLVAWITTGFLHIPHAEDIPNTVTVGNGVSILLRPYNYYDTDPSIYSPDGVFFSSEQDSSVCEVNHIACLSKTASCLPVLPPFTYDGFQNLTRL